MPLTHTLAEALREHVLRVLWAPDVNGNISEAARRLGIYRSSLQRRLRRWQSKTSDPVA
jgi:DNA-binding PucR family transcriptional regulator